MYISESYTLPLKRLLTVTTRVNATAPITIPNCTARKDSRAESTPRPPDGSAKKSRNLGNNIKLAENIRKLKYKSRFQYNNREQVVLWLYKAAEVQAQRPIAPC